MELHIDDSAKIAEVWLTNADQSDERLAKQLSAFYKRMKNKGYLAVVYRSGSGDLYQQTSDLLCYNRKRVAELEQRAEQKHIEM